MQFILQPLQALRLRSAVTLLASGAIFAAIILWDTIMWRDGAFLNIFLERPPETGLIFYLRSFSILSACGLMAYSCSAKPPQQPDSKTVIEGLDLSQKIAALVTFIIAFTLVGILMSSPALFHELSLEDGLFEYGSAFLFFGCAILCVSNVMILYLKKNRGYLLLLVPLSLAGIFFLIAMEEVSWFQRVFEIETPELLDGNLQQEMNLHNLATNQIENIYYMGSFIFLVFLPFLKWQQREVFRLDYLTLFVARPHIAIIGSIACAYNYDMWNIFSTQAIYFFALVTVAMLCQKNIGKHGKLLCYLALIHMIIAQYIYLTSGQSYDRLWEITEFKEFFIPVAFVTYCLDVTLQIKRHKASVQL